jgi:hypothetical protein
MALGSISLSFFLVSESNYLLTSLTQFGIINLMECLDELFFPFYASLLLLFAVFSFFDLLLVDRPIVVESLKVEEVREQTEAAMENLHIKVAVGSQRERSEDV